MEIHSVALGYVGDKIRNIAIRIRFTTEFFFEHGFIGLTRMLRSWRYCLPDATKQPKTDTYFFIFLFIDIFSSVQSL